MNKKILISQEIFYRINYSSYYDILELKWYDLMSKIGYSLLPAPNNNNQLNKILNNIDFKGIILTGGGDLFNNKLNKKIIIRNKIESKLINYGVKNNIPVLGVCRGMMLINQYFGGKISKINNHVNNNHYIYGELFNKTIKVKVNSFHSYGIKPHNIGNNLINILSDKKNNIEMLKHQKFKIYGIMWHPERRRNIFDYKLIKKIFNN